MMNSQLRNIAAPGGRTEDVTVLIHPADAASVGIAPGGRVRVRAAHTGQGVVARAEVTDGIRKGTISLPHGWADPNVCALTSATSGVDPLTGMVWQSGIDVDIEPYA
jgi:anaerobic selenocysteine-containing dehydrogenase